jgi:CRISPR-associated protein Csh1
MLTTLIKLGAQLSEDRGEWDDIIDYPNIENETKKGIPLYVAELIFDLDRQDIDFGDLEEYDKHRSCQEYKYIKIQGGNNKAIYACAESGKLEQIRKTFFGALDSKGNSPASGQFQEFIQKDFPAFKTTLFATLLPKIFTLKDVFEKMAISLKEVKGQEVRSIDEKLLLQGLKALPPNAKVILYYTSVLSASDGINQPTPLSEIEGFQEIMRAKFLNKGGKKEALTEGRISYATGLKKTDATNADFPNRYSLNYMFVETTLNYASGFDKASFHNNYQVSREEQLLLERGSKYILENLKIRIAGIDHCIIPHFLNSSTVDIKYITKDLLEQNELLFDQASIDRLDTGVKTQTDQPFWLTYLAFESDGNFFKTIHQIKDVSELHFYRVLESIYWVNRLFTDELTTAVDWAAVSTNFGKTFCFNLSSIYSIIPTRKEKEKKNNALSLFKSIFENRKIDANRLFRFFCELMLCHRFGRYKAFTNVKEYEDRSFDFAVRDGVFKYLAFIQVLKHLKLLTIMDENELNTKPSESPTNDYSRKMYAFLDHMGYNVNQRAMFFLGRMLNSVAYLQEGKKKTVLDKVNFNGMQLPSILRLRNSLIEKAKQYDGILKVKFIDSEFTAHFKYEGWNMNAEEAVFFLLSGYSYGIIKSKDKENNNQTTNN